MGNRELLTPRETEVLDFVATGSTDGEIAYSLGISTRTVNEHVRHILKALDVTNRTQAAVLRAGTEPECFAPAYLVPLSGRLIDNGCMAESIVFTLMLPDPPSS